MIWPNRPATDWRERAKTLPSKSQSLGTNLGITWVSDVYWQWGNQYSAGIHGIQFAFTATESPTGVWAWQVVATAPWSSHTWTGTGAITSVEAVGEWTNRHMVVSGSCGWTHTFNALVITLYINGVADPTTISIGAQSESGTGFDKRLCGKATPDSAGVHGIDAAIATVFFATPVPSGPPTCTPSTPCVNSPAAELQVNPTGTCEVIYGWEYKVAGVWTTDTVLVDNTLAPSPSCPCAQPLEDVSAVDSYNITISTDLTYDRTANATGLHTYGPVPCFGLTAGAVMNIWQLSELVQGHTASVTGLPQDFGVLQNEKQTSWSCDGVAGTPTDTMGSDTMTVSAMSKSVFYSLGTRDCDCKVSGTGICSGDSVCSIFGYCNQAGTFCSYTGSATRGWPTAPGCGGSLWPWNHATSDGRFYRTDIETGDAWVFGSHFQSPPFDTAVQVTTTGDVLRPACVEDFRKRLWLTYTRTIATVLSSYIRFSDDDGQTFSTETMSIPNSHYTIPFSDADGNLGVAGLVYVSGSSGPCHIKAQYRGSGDTALGAVTTLVDDTGTPLVVQDTTFGIVRASHGASALILSCVIDGETASSEWQCWNETDFSFKRI